MTAKERATKKSPVAAKRRAKRGNVETESVAVPADQSAEKRGRIRESRPSGLVIAKVSR